MCARIHLHVLLRAADTHTYPYGYDNFDSITYDDAITCINCDSDRDTNAHCDRNAKTHTNSEIQSNAALSPYSAATPVALL